MREEHTDTEGDHIDTHDDGAHGGWEELANTTQHHDHTDGDVDETAVDMVSIVFIALCLFFRRASPIEFRDHSRQHNIQDVREIHFGGIAYRVST